ncbi:Gfo/Idh/MocA family oxidoreductase [Methylobacterium terricola]|uniref:Gfo/Idh/MocA family oxidoreductase n=1 Tax=Methylobacterium terricola TaxID=2583531 RepID=A0A5C4L619_9HYPH|nr:Gfo/Idh/MocA family oxidoreductase [Methylobacterium terricola]TNC05869.1 Gfo/Idh/MocA family oxidoreductase [Methylobacterium terricola]
MHEVRIAVAGAGLIGRRHIEEIGRSRGTRLSAIVDPGPDAAAIAEREGVPLFGTLESCFATARPDGVVLATPNRLHVPQGLACIAAGLPVLIEKPLAHGLDEGERLVAAAEAAGARVLVGHHRQHSPLMRRAVEAIRSGLLGRIVGVIGSAVFCKPDGYFEGPNAWRREPGGGPLLINMIHEIGNLRAMVGEIAAVQATASNAVRGFSVEDTVAMSLRFANGALGTFLLSDTAASARSWEQTSRENAAYPTYPDEDAYTILGTDGSLAVPTFRLKRYARPEERSWFAPFACETLAVERADPLAEQIAHFAAVIRGEAEPLVSARDGLQNLRVVDAIARAARTGGTVEL